MLATVGDRIMIMSQRLAEPVREGEIVEVHGADGAPPYVVRWFEDGHTGVLFPGPDARILHRTVSGAPEQAGSAVRWRVGVDLVEHGTGLTSAHIVADTGSRVVHGYGEARRRPGDPEIAAVGDELAVGRAFRAVGDELVQAADDDFLAAEQSGAAEGAPGATPES